MPSSARLLLCLLLTPLSAHAYIDPGSGMLLWQGLIAVIGAVVIFVSHPVQTVKAWWAKLTKRK